MTKTDNYIFKNINVLINAQNMCNIIYLLPT